MSEPKKSSHNSLITNTPSTTSNISNPQAELWRKTVHDQKLFRHLRIFVSELGPTSQPTRRLYHLRRNDRLKASRDKAEKWLATYPELNRKHSLATVPEGSVNISPLFKGSVGQATTDIAHGELSELQLVDGPSPNHNEITRILSSHMERIPQDKRPLRPSSGYPSHLIDVKRATATDNASPRLNVQRWFRADQTMVKNYNISSRSVVSAPSVVFGNWDLSRMSDSRSNYSAPDDCTPFLPLGLSGRSGIDLRIFIEDSLQRVKIHVGLDQSLAHQAHTYIYLLRMSFTWRC